jgi:hypothetical protein
LALETSVSRPREVENIFSCYSEMRNEASVSNGTDEIPILCAEKHVKTSTSLKKEHVKIGASLKKQLSLHSSRTKPIEWMRDTLAATFHSEQLQ